MKRGLLLFGFLFCLVAVSHLAWGEAAGACGRFLGPIELSKDTLNFGQVAVGGSKTLSFLIIDPINFESDAEVVSIKSHDPAFVVISDGFCMNSGEEVEIDVTFMPTETGGYRSVIEVDYTNPPIPQALIATSSVGKLYVTVAGVGIGSNLSANPSPLNFGTVKVGDTSTKSLTLSNSGKAGITISQIQSSLGNFFVSSGGFPHFLPSDGTFDVNIGFAPNTGGSFSGKLSIIDSNSETVLMVPVAGSGFGPPHLNVNPLELDYGQMTDGTAKDLPLILSNTGFSPLVISAFEFSDPTFKTSPEAPLEIGPGGSVGVTVRFRTSVPAVQSPRRPSVLQKETLTIVNSDPDQGEFIIQLSVDNVGPGANGFVPDNSTPFHSRNLHTNGIQWIDYNVDHLDDLYFCGSEGNRLYKNIGGGNFSDVTVVTNTGNDHNHCVGASWADVDNDGDPDVAIFNTTGIVFLRNNHGVFAVSSGGLKPFGASTAPPPAGGIWLDFNNDGNVDLFVVRNGASDQLFKATGFFQFADVSASAHVDFTGPGKSVVAGDINGDHYIDIYVVNNNAPNKLFVNNKNETFREAGASAGVAFNGDSQQADMADYDGDGDLDIFVVNGDGPSALFNNIGGTKFQNVSSSAGIAGPHNGKAASFNDTDNDGDADLIFIQSPGDNFLFKNLGNGKFQKVNNVDLTDDSDPSTVSSGDSDNDGNNDTVVGDSGTQSPNNNTLYQNTGGNGNHYLNVVLQGIVSNKSAIGAVVLLRAGLILQAQQVSSGDGQSQDSPTLEFGLGDNTSASLSITWPSGITQNLQNVAADQTLPVTEPAQD